MQDFGTPRRQLTDDVTSVLAEYKIGWTAGRAEEQHLQHS
jgi:hypothetical protein